MSDDGTLRPPRGLPPDVRAMLRAESARVSINDDARARLATRLAASVAVFGAPPAPPQVPAAPPAVAANAATNVATNVAAAKAAGLAATGTKLVAALALSAAAIVGGQRLLGGANGAARSAPVTAIAPPPLVMVPMTAPASPAPLLPVEPLSSPPPSSPSPSPEPPPRRSAPASAPLPSAIAAVAAADASTAVPTRAPADTGGLLAEQELLDEARADLDRGDPAAALGATQAHASRFPRGALAEARDALRVRALARLGRSDEARRDLATFRAEHPRSLLLPAASDDAGTIP